METQRSTVTPITVNAPASPAAFGEIVDGLAESMCEFMADDPSSAKRSLTDALANLGQLPQSSPLRVALFQMASAWATIVFLQAEVAQ